MTRSPAWWLLPLSLAACSGGEEEEPSLSVDTTAIDFGSVALGSEATDSIQVTNTGGGALTLLSTTLVDGDPQIWEVRSAGTVELFSGESVAIPVVFSPNAETPEAGRISLRTSLETVFVRLDGLGAPSTLDNDGDGQSSADGDCDDDDATTFKGAAEACDGRDNNCDGTIPANEQDADSDGFRLCDDDCNDDLATAYPGAVEVCDDADSDCDGNNRDRSDADGDGLTLCDGDCDDTSATVGPGQDEICANGIDEDCTGIADDVDKDGDGHSLCSEAGDCDDDDAAVYPIIVDASAAAGGDGTEAAPYQTLSEGHAAIVADCPDLWAAAGTYTDALVVGSAITITGATDSAGEPLVTWTPTAGAHAVEVGASGNLAVSDLVISGASFSGDGGAISVDGGSLTLSRVRLENNAATGDGGAIAVSSGSLTAIDSVLAQNTADDDGGAIAVLSGALTLVDSRVSANAGKNGGGIFASSSTVSIQGTRMAGNAASGSGGGSGGGLYAAGGNVTVLRSELDLNTASASGGAIALTDVATGRSEIHNNTLQDNEGGGQGGAISVRGTTTVAITNNSLTGNGAGDGGVIWANVQSGELDLISNLAQATTVDTGKAAFAVSGSNPGDITHNTSFQASSGVHFADEAVEHSGDDPTENRVDVPGFTKLTDNGNPADDNLALGTGSGARDSGPSGSEWNDVDGSRNDRGYTGGPEASP